MAKEKNIKAMTCKMILFFLACLCITAFAQEKGTFTDSRDSKTYKWVKIGTQTWMAENLNYNAKGSRCYNDSIANCDKYGRLYGWASAMALPDSCNKHSCSSQISAKHRGICPTGWHIPSNAKWDKLILYVDGTSGVEYTDSYTAGKYLKAASGWNSYEGKSGNGTDDYGFSALPGGDYLGSSFGRAGKYGIWWSASEVDASDGEGDASLAYFRGMDYNNDRSYWNGYAKSHLFSVRCLRD